MTIDELSIIVFDLKTNKEFITDDINLIDEICELLNMLDVKYLLGQNTQGFVIEII